MGIRNLDRLVFLLKLSLQNWYFDWITHVISTILSFILKRRDLDLRWGAGRLGRGDGFVALMHQLESKYFLTIHTASQNVFSNAPSLPSPLLSHISIVLHCPNIVKFEQKKNKKYSILKALGLCFIINLGQELFKGHGVYRSCYCFGLWSASCMYTCFHILTEYPLFLGREKCTPGLHWGTWPNIPSIKWKPGPK